MAKVTDTMSQNNPHSEQRLPVCECDDRFCFEPLGIDWYEYERQHKKGVLLSRACAEQSQEQVIESHDTYVVVKGAMAQ
jgi:hypothetical protein